MSRFGRRDDATEPGGAGGLGGAEEPERPGMLDDPGIPEDVQRMVRARGSAARPYPHLVRNRGRHPLLLLAALPEALVHVEFVQVDGGRPGERPADYSVDFVPWPMLESVRVNGPTIRFAWGGRAIVTEMTSHAEALQMARSFLGQSREGL